MIVQKKYKGNSINYIRNKNDSIGSTPFRRNIFNKHQLDKNSLLIKSGMTSNIKDLTPEIESPIKSQNNNIGLATLRSAQTGIK